MKKLAALLVTLLAIGVVVWVLRPGASKPGAKDFPTVTWEDLGGFKYTPKKTALPDRVLKMKGQKIQLKGFMLPVDFSGRKVRTFLLSRDQNACCFGIMPAFNEWLFVRMAPNRPADVLMDRPVTVWGVLDVGEEVKDGQVTSLYRITAEGVLE